LVEIFRITLNETSVIGKQFQQNLFDFRCGAATFLSGMGKRCVSGFYPWT
jgi:hypothetical protein